MPASVASRKHATSGETVVSQANDEGDGSVNSARLAALLDKLVVVQLDLKPICKVRAEASLASAERSTIAEACEILHSLIADLREAKCPTLESDCV
jgi:hypothetical protein